MARNEAQQKKIDDIKYAIFGRVSGFKGFLADDEFPDWFGLAISDLALTIEDPKSIEFIDGETIEGEYAHNPHKARILVFTKTLLIEIEGSRDDKKQESRKTTIRSRDGLADLSIEAELSAFKEHSGRDVWPGPFTIDLSYSDGRAFRLPLGASGDYQYSERLTAFLPTLLDDLQRK